MAEAQTNEGVRQVTFACRACLWLGAGWSGAAVMAFELLGARLLMPTFGMGIEVWAAVIATTLGTLAIGCWLGGRLADARPSTSTLAWVLLLAGASFLTVQVGGHRAIGWFGDMPFVAAAWLAAATILAAPLVLLGMVQPILARLMVRQGDKVGSVVGGLLAASTLGGVAGTVLTGLVLIPHAGVSKALFIISCGSVATAIVTLVASRSWKQAAFAAVLLAAAAAAMRQIRPSSYTDGAWKVIDEVEGRYGHLEVVEYRGTTALLCDGIFQTALPSSGTGLVKGMLIRGHDYVELVPYFRPMAGTSLLIGLGGGLHEQAMALYSIRVHAVEIEPAVVALATKHFGLAVDVTVADARAFLARDRRRFDAIILDAFLGSTVPEHLYTREAFELMAGHLSGDGILVLHLVSRPRHAATRAVAATLKAVFTHIIAACSGWANELQHVYLFASQRPLELRPQDRLELDGLGFTGRELCHIDAEGQALLTDDQPALALLSRDLVREHRRQSLERRRQPPW